MRGERVGERVRSGVVAEAEGSRSGGVVVGGGGGGGGWGGWKGGEVDQDQVNKIKQRQRLAVCCLNLPNLHSVCTQ